MQTDRMHMERPKARRKAVAAPRGAALSTPMDELGPLVHAVAKGWREKLDHRLHPLGLSRAKWMALLRLSRAGGRLTQRELAALLEIGAPAMVTLTDRLEREGLALREAVPGDRRAKAIRLTPASRRLLTRIEGDARRLRVEIVAGLSAPEQGALSALLGKLKARIDELP